jgi:LemA protein
MAAIISFLIFVIIIIAIAFVLIYNKLQQAGQGVKASHSNVLTVIQKRADLANKLQDIAKGYGDHEKLVQISVSNNLVETFKESSNAIANVNAIAQQYPDLKANATYQQLMLQLNQIEDELQRKREIYNSIAGNYNSMRLQIPTIFFASAMGFKEAPYFDFDNLQAIKDFKTDDGEMLKNVIAGVASKAKGAAKKGVDIVQSNIHKNAPEEQQNVDVRFCDQCGAKLQANSKFCNECGAKTSE